MAKTKNQEVEKCTSIRVADALPPSSEGAPHNRGVRGVGASRRQINDAEKELPHNRGFSDRVGRGGRYTNEQNQAREYVCGCGPGHENRPTCLFWTINSLSISYCILYFY